LQALFVLLALFAWASQANAKVKPATNNEFPGKHWTQATKPEDRGWSSEKLAAAKAYADTLDTAAVVIVDDEDPNRGTALVCLRSRGMPERQDTRR